MSDAPEHGGRILLVRREVGDADVTYAVELTAAGDAFHADLCIAVADGAVTVGAYDREPPAWLAAAVAPLARTLWTGRAKDPNQPWPRRLHRWREPR